MTERLSSEKASLCQAGQWLDARGYVPATSGNFSLRVRPDATDRSLEGGGANRMLVTRSGVHKGRLTQADLLLVEHPPQGHGFHVLEGQGRPSAEALLHSELYTLYPDVGAALHYHSVASTVLSLRHAAQGQLVLSGYELLKALEGVTTHDTDWALPVFANAQDMPALAGQIRQRLTGAPNPWALMIAGHGMYVWGDTLADALRHVEALEFMFACQLQVAP